MKILGAILVVLLLVGIPAAAHYETSTLARNQAAGKAAQDLLHLRNVVTIDELKLQNLELDEQIAERQHKRPDHVATRDAQAKLIADTYILRLAEGSTQ